MTRYALVIGISSYNNFPNLPKAVIDAEAVACYLEQHRYTVTRLPAKLVSENQWAIDQARSLTAHELGTELNKFVSQTAKHQPAIIYIAGHGFLTENPLTGKNTGYLAASNSERDGNYAIKFEDLRILFSKAELSSLNVWMDCCYAGELIASGQLLDPLKTGLKQQPNACLIAACRDFERAREGKTHGIFTAALLEGLAPERAKEGRILSTDLLNWVTEALRTSGQQAVHSSEGQPIVLIEGLRQNNQYIQSETRSSPVRLKPPFILPKKDISTFTGRLEELAQMKDLLLHQQQGEKVCSILGLAGSAGIGKSALACHFAKMYQDEFPDGVIGLRVDGKDVNTIAREFARRAGNPIDPDDDSSAAVIMQDVFASKRMLLIFDNVETADIKVLCPGGNRCAVIVTTRKRNLPFSLDIADEATIDLPPLTEADALLLLKKILRDDRIESALTTAKGLVKLVGNLPLALQVVGAVLRGKRRSLDDYAESLQEEREELLEELQVEDDRDLNVEASLSLSLKQLSEEEKDFFACISVCAVEGFAERTAMAAAGYDNKRKTQKRLDRLYDLSLLHYVDTGENRYVLHPLVQVYAEKIAQKQGLKATARERHANFFVELLQSDDLEDETVLVEVAADLDDVMIAARWLKANQTEEQSDKQKIYQFTRKLQSLFEQYGYWQEAINLMGNFQALGEEFGDWYTVIRCKMQEARYWSFSEEFERAEEILKAAQGDLEKIKNTDNRKKRQAKLLNVLGGVFQKWGKKKEAIQIFRELILLEENIGDFQALKINYNRLGGLLKEYGRLEEAQSLFERSIKISEQLNDLKQLQISLNSLGILLRERGKLEEAQSLFERSIKISEQLNDLKQLPISLNSLGELLRGQKKPEEAQSLFERSIKISEQLNDLKQLQISLNSLGILFREQEKLEEAQEVFERSVQALEQLNDWENLFLVLQTLGWILRDQGKFDQSYPIFQRRVEVAQKLQDKDKLIESMMVFATILKKHHRFDEAIINFEQIKIMVENMDKPDLMIKVLRNLGEIKSEKNNLVDAIKEYKIAIDILKKNNTLDRISVINLIVSLSKSINLIKEENPGNHLIQGLFKDSLNLLEDLFKDRSGEDVKSPNLLSIKLVELGELLQTQDAVEGALECFERSVQISEDSKDYKQLAISLNALANLLIVQREIQRAQELFERSIQISEDLEDTQQLVVGLNGLRAVLTIQKKYHDCLSVCHRIVKILETRNFYDIADELFHYLRNLQSIFLCSNDHKGALQAAKLRVKVAQSFNEDDLLQATLCSYSHLELVVGLERLENLLYQGKFETIQKYLEQQIQASYRQNDLLQMGIQLCLLGDLQIQQQEWLQAENTFRHCFDLTTKLVDALKLQAIVCNKLGQISAQQSGEVKFKQALMYFHQSIKLGEQLQDYAHFAQTHNAMAEAYLSRKDYAKAILSFIQGFNINEVNSNIHSLERFGSKLIYLLRRLNRRDEARQYCQRALAVVPNSYTFQRLQNQLEANLSMIQGTITSIERHKSGERRGFVNPDQPLENGQKIYFRERFLELTDFDSLRQGSVVEVEIEKWYKGWVAIDLQPLNLDNTD